MNRPLHRLPAAAALAATAVLALGGCASTPPSAEDSPAEVAVAKDAPFDVDDVPVATLDRFDPDRAPGAGGLVWGPTLERVWLPQATEVVPGIDGASTRVGSAYLTVPATFDRTADRVSAQQDRAAFTDYLEVDVPAEAGQGQAQKGDSVDPATPAPEAAEDSADEPDAPSTQGKVLQGVRDGVRYTVTLYPDDDPQYTVVMVAWEPDPDAAATPNR